MLHRFKGMAVFLGLGVAQLASAAQVEILRLDYGDIRANRDYTTGIQAIAGAPRSISTIHLTLTGDYCSFISQNFWYVRASDNTLRSAVLTAGDTAEINDVATAIKYDFKQDTYTHVDCSIGFFTEESDDPPVGDITTATRDLFTSATLFKLDVIGNSDYAGVVVLGAEFADLTELLRDTASGTDNDRIRRAFALVETKWTEVNRAFFTAHANALNAQMWTSFQDLQDCFDRAKTAVNSLN